MAKVTFIIGLAGSGKSNLASRLRKETGAEILEEAEGDENCELPQVIARYLKDGKSCIVVKIACCYPLYRDQVVNYLRSRLSDVEMEFICFEKDLETANRNVRHRLNEKDAEESIYGNLHYFDIYEYPAESEILPLRKQRNKLDSSRHSRSLHFNKQSQPRNRH